MRLVLLLLLAFPASSTASLGFLKRLFRLDEYFSDSGRQELPVTIQRLNVHGILGDLLSKGAASEKESTSTPSTTTTTTTRYFPPPDQPRILPEGDLPHQCCKYFCFPIEIGCTCCFLDYEYFNGVDTVKVNGVPDWLRPKALMDYEDYSSP